MAGAGIIPTSPVDAIGPAPFPSSAVAVSDTVEQAAAVKVAVRHGGKILFLKRAASAALSPGRWDFPGGRVTPGESPVEAVAREVREETGLTVDALRVVDTWAWSPSETLHFVGIGFAAETGDDRVRLSDEHDAFRWLTPEQAITEMPDWLTRIVRAAGLATAGE